MKKLITIVICCVCAYSVSAQYTYGEPVESNKRTRTRSTGGDYKQTRIGIFIAPNNSWMKPTASKSNDGLYMVNSEGAKIGYTWGLMIDHFFTENYGIATGVQLNTTGGKMNAVYDMNKLPATAPVNLVKSANFDYRLQYFEVPFGLKLLSDELSGGVRVFGNLGITAALNIARKGTYEVVYTDTVNGVSVEKTVTGENERLRGGLSITPIMFQMNLGAGIEYSVSQKMSLYVGLFFNNGFAPDATNPKELNMEYKGNFSDGNVRLNNMSLKIGMFF